MDVLAESVLNSLNYYGAMPGNDLTLVKGELVNI